MYAVDCAVLTRSLQERNSDFGCCLAVSPDRDLGGGGLLVYERSCSDRGWLCSPRPFLVLWRSTPGMGEVGQHFGEGT